MANVIAQASMSLDGFIATPGDGVGALFDWYENGDVPFSGDPERVFHVSQASADYLREPWANVANEVIGRRLFDLTNGWDGRPAVGEHVFVVTYEPPTGWPYPDAPFTFVTEGLERAIAMAKERAGDRDVALTAGDLTGQALRAGLVDELRVDLIPVLFGAGVRFFGDYTGPHVLLEDPEVVQGTRVTHLHYRVRTRP